MYLMVLNESHTFSTLAGCKIVHAPDDTDEETIASALVDLEAGVESELTLVRRFGPTPIDEEVGLGRTQVTG